MSGKRNLVWDSKYDVSGRGRKRKKTRRLGVRKSNVKLGKVGKVGKENRIQNKRGNSKAVVAKYRADKVVVSKYGLDYSENDYVVLTKSGLITKKDLEIEKWLEKCYGLV